QPRQVGRERSAAAAPARRRRSDQPAVSGGVPPHHRRRALRSRRRPLLMRLAPEGRIFIAIAALLTLVLAALGYWIAFGVAAVVTLWVIAFFRDPTRAGPWGEHDIVAPADGKVVSVIETDEPAFFG